MKKDETWILIAGVVFLFWLEGRRKPGGDTYFTPMPDYHRPEFDPKAIEIKPSKTPATLEQMAAAFRRGYRNVTGDDPSKRMLVMMLAVSAQETDEWRAMWEWNPGNLTTLNPRGYFRIPGDPDKLKYAPFPDAATGAAAMVNRFGTKFPKSMGLMLTAEPEDVARMMKREGYYTGPADAYARRVRQFFDKFAPLIPGPVT